MSLAAFEVVSTTTGMLFSSPSALTTRSTSAPDRFGRLRSSRMTSGLGAAAYFPSRRRNASASSPSSTTCSWLGTRPSFRASNVSRASAGSSSMSRICTGGGPSSAFIALHPRCRGGGEKECGALTKLGIEPNAPARALHDLLAHGKADAGARVLGAAVEALEDHEDLVVVHGVDPDPVVAHKELPLVPLARAPHDD